ncbi:MULTISPECIES: hypothetical protein [unclassified Methylomonas]|uniref:hypothetical protein n=1 Tax=unclassified Methylomonas TaxID=2608980 RepID=UPI000ADF1AAC|nr:MULTISPECIES: hypothetical protein [unclassified Methylomonas]NJA04511.1 hypothetical protein [Methylococcaceae bacterium WWC4]WGS85906.1 hypothetical protein QC632_23175 [Methylomonas sp. UP202]
MRRSARTVVCSTLMLVIAGCGSADQPPDAPRAGGDGRAVAEALQKPVEQARDAEKQIFESAERQKQAADQM